MTQLSPVSRLTPSSPEHAVRPGGEDRRESSTSAPRAPDRVELSADARRLGTNATDIRSELVARIRAELDAGTYETEARIAIAADGLLRDLTGA